MPPWQRPSIFRSVSLSADASDNPNEPPRTHPAELHDGIWTSWLPLATAWPSQPACTVEVWARFGIQPSNNDWPYIDDRAYGQSVANSPTCLPPAATQWWDEEATSSGTVTRFSLGPIDCPAAYATVRTTGPVSGTSTSIICCPRSSSPQPELNAASKQLTLAPQLGLRTKHFQQ